MQQRQSNRDTNSMFNDNALKVFKIDGFSAGGDEILFLFNELLR